MASVKPDLNRIPAHIAIVMDGNGRWAKEKGMPRVAGHNAGMQALKEIVKRCSVLGVKHLTVYAFSTENWKRPQEEVGGIFKLLVLYINSELKELCENNVKVSVLGETAPLPAEAVQKLQEALEATKDNDGMEFHIALNYGGRREILLAIQDLAKDVAAGKLAPEAIADEDLEARLFTAGFPDPDLLIRTGGEKRLSNFLLWQAAYSELVFTDTWWPDFTPECLEDAIVEYQSRDRRYGGLTADGKGTK